jgi:hypothetical protein
LTASNVLSRILTHTAASDGVDSNTTTADHTFIPLWSLFISPADARSLQLCRCIPNRSHKLRLDLSIQLRATAPTGCGCSSVSSGVGVYSKATGDAYAHRNDDNVHATEDSDFLFLYAELYERQCTFVECGGWSWREEAV